MDDKLYWYKAKCINVVDGDTIDIEINLGFKIYIKERIRLYGIDSSEIFGVKIGSEEYNKGMICKNRIQDLILNKEIWLNTFRDKQEKYGRYLGIIYFNNEQELVNLNNLLLSEGLVKTATY